MQKIGLCFLLTGVLLVSSGCVKPRSPAAADTELSQRFLRLRGYEFDEKNFLRQRRRAT